MNCEVRPGYQRTEAGVIPEDWSDIKLQDLTTEIGDGIHSTPEYSSQGEYYFINGNNLNDGKVSITNDTKLVSYNEFKKHKSNLCETSILLSINGTIGNLALYKGEPLVLGKSAAYLNIRTSISKIFLYHALQTDGIKRQFEEGLTGTTIRNLGLGTIRSTIVPIPSNHAEQQEIASTLSGVDALISSLDQLIAKKRDIQQAAMQQLLTGQRRLPGFSGEWKNRELGEVIKEISDGGTPSTADPSNFGGKIHWVVIEDIQPEIKSTRSTLTEKGLQKCASKLWPAGTLILSTGATIGEVGVLQIDAATKQGICGIIFNDAIAATIFMRFWFIQNKSLLLSKAQGSSIKEIRAPTLVKLCVRLPEVDEQTAIAAILSDMDTELAALEARRDKARQLKQGMMQELLTGRIRLV